MPQQTLATPGAGTTASLPWSAVPGFPGWHILGGVPGQGQAGVGLPPLNQIGPQMPFVPPGYPHQPPQGLPQQQAAVTQGPRV